MKLEALQQKVEVVKGDQAEDTSYSIDAKNMHLAIQAFYQYSDPIGSIIREITSNGYDAHIEAEVDKPVIVRINTLDCSLDIIDFGVGLSPDRVNDIFTKFFSSTKRDTNNQIGAFGLGSKSPLSYTDMFQVTTKFGNSIYEYVIHKAEGVPSLVKLSQQTYGSGLSHNAQGNSAKSYQELKDEHGYPWNEHENGTQVTIPFKKDDTSQFISSAKKQLCYFDGVVLDVYPAIESEKKQISDYNQQIIHKGDAIIYREGDKDAHGISGMHICIGKVFYTINNLSSQIDHMKDSKINELIEAVQTEYKEKHGKKSRILRKFSTDLSSYYSPLKTFVKKMQEVPIGLYFDIGDLPIIWHRENIEYTEQAWESILKKMFRAAAEIYDLQKKEIPDIADLEQALNAKAKQDNAGTGQVYMSSKCLQATDVKIVIPELEELSIRDTFSEYQARPDTFLQSFIGTHKDSGTIYPKDIVGTLDPDKPNTVFVIDEGERRKAGLKDFMEDEGLKLLTIKNPNPSFKLPSSQAIYAKYARQAIRILEKLPRANDIEVPETQTIQKSSKVSELPLLYRRFGSSGDVTYRRTDLMKTFKGNQSWNDLDKMPTLLIYGFQDDREMLNKLVTYNTETLTHAKFCSDAAYNYNKRAILGVISKENAEIINDYCPAIHVKDMIRHRRYISRLATRHLIGLYIKRNPWFETFLLYNGDFDSKWMKLRNEKIITPEEYQTIKTVGSYVYKVYSKDHYMYPYIKEALKSKYYYYDELEILKWVHGMHAKYAPLLYSDARLYYPDEENPAQSYYAEKIFERLQLNINPTLYRKYHVKNIES